MQTNKLLMNSAMTSKYCDKLKQKIGIERRQKNRHSNRENKIICHKRTEIYALPKHRNTNKQTNS